MRRRLPALPYPLLLLGLLFLAYGLWIPRLGLYWDDFPLAWIARTYGAPGLERYFATNRPFWGLLFQLTTPILGANPLAWQVFGALMRFVDALLLWQLLRLAWPRREEAARWAGALFLVYPGFSQQFIALVYGHMELVLASFLGSQVLMLLGLRRGVRRGWRLLSLSLLLSAVNVFCMEYFLLLELARPLLILVILRQKDTELLLGKGLLRSLLIVLPWLAVLLGAMAWRTWGLGFHTYQPAFAARLSSEPLAALAGLAGRAARDLWLAGAEVWSRPFLLTGLGELTRTQLLVFWAVAGMGLAGALLMLLPRVNAATLRKESRFDWLSWLLFGAALLIFAGGPYWLTDLPITKDFPFDRFTLSFMCGAAALLAGLWSWLPLPRGFKVGLLALTLAFSAALQYRYSLIYARDWATQRTLFRQLLWRAPGFQPGTTLLFNELPVVHYSDNSLTAPLNWIYAPENRSQQMSYMLYYPTVRLGSGLPRIEPGLEIRQDYLAAQFSGNTGQVLVLYFQPPGCLRVMDPEVEADVWLIPPSLRDTLRLANPAVILPEGQARLPRELYGAEPAKNWCWYFEKADLARQQKDWAAAAALGDAAFALGDYPNDALERFPFIEAYAHTGNWERALELTQQTRDIAPLYAQLGCRLWQRIEREAGAVTGVDEAVSQAYEILGCGEMTP